MSDIQPKPRAPEDGDTTVLHLSRFVGGGANPGDSGPGRPESSESSTELVRKAAREAVAEQARPLVVPRNAAPMAPDELLGAVAYCYIKGVYSSADIERKMLRDAEFRNALDGIVPDPATIRRFRRLNREAIRLVLEKFYAQRRREQRPVREVRPGLATHSADPATEAPSATSENTASFVRREASDCLDKATFVDGMSDY